MEIHTSVAPAEIRLKVESTKGDFVSTKVLDAREELRQPVVGVGGAQEDQGQERFAL